MQQIAEWLTPLIRVSEDPNDLWQFRVARKFGTSPDLAAASLEVARIEQRQAELAELWGKGELTSSAWQAARAPLDKAARVATAALEAAQEHAAGLNELAALDAQQFVERWREMELLERRRVINALVTEIRVRPHRGPANKPDLDRIEIHYKPELAG
jgi:hypothetical protein